MIDVIDDFLPQGEYKPIFDYMMGSDFPWFWNQSHMFDDLTYNLTSLPDKENQVDYPQLVCGIYNDNDIVDSNLYKIVKPLINRIQYSKLIRVKANLNVKHIRCDETKYGHQHTDTTEEGAYTAIYYVNDCDGDTVFLNGDGSETRVSPKANRFVLFPATLYHCGNTPKQSDRRVVININWIPL